jgi:streptogramin lyase
MLLRDVFKWGLAQGNRSRRSRRPFRAGYFRRPDFEALEGRIVLNAYTFTTDADFDKGVYLSLNHDPNHNQLQLNSVSTPFPFINIAASGRGTMQRIDTVTGQILGEYGTAPQNMAKNPSRTTVDQFGNVWVTNRDEASGNKGSITRIGLIIGGTRGNKNADGSFTPDPNGQYVKDPLYSTAVDRDGDGLLKTSRGLGNILSWSNAGAVDSNGGVSTAEDELIINYTRTVGTNARGVAVDANNDVWVGGPNYWFEKLSGVTGQPVPGTQVYLGYGGYGSLMDKNGILWSATWPGSGPLVRYNPATQAKMYITPNGQCYGLGIDPAGNIWLANWTNNTVQKIDPSGTVLGTFGSHGSGCRGVAVTPADSDVWVACSYSNAVARLHNDGTFVQLISVGGEPTGVAVDAAGKVWVTNYGSSSAMRINPATNTVDLTVSLGSGAYPYNYSDMTGMVVIGSTTPQGTWDVVQDGGAQNLIWNKIVWNQEPQGSVPPGTSIVVEARAANTQAGLTGQPFVAVTSGGALSLSGQFIEARATLKKGTATASPVLSDITLNSGAPPRVVALNALFGSQKYDVLANFGHRTYLPWKVTGFEFVFDRAVIAQLGDLADTDVTPLSFSSMTGSGTDHVTWSLTNPAAADRIMLRLASGGVTDLSGTDLLDGNGDGVGGDPFTKLVQVLWGDIDDSGIVTVHDFVRIRNAASEPYSIFADMDGDGDNDADETNMVRYCIGRKIV